MGKYKTSFDKIINRRNTGCLKFDHGISRKGRDDLIPLWVADMDFQLPEIVLDKIKERVDHGIFGYTEPDTEYYEALKKWYQKRHGWAIEEKWTTVTPGVVYAIATAIKAFTKEGDAVLLQSPVYYPFYKCIESNQRVLIDNPLVYKDGHYQIDFEDYEKKIVDNGVKLFLLCNPHNPVGRVWRREELLRIGEICRKHNVIVFADEIHGDFTYSKYQYIPFASLGKEISELSVVGTSGSKTFNLAGLQTANIFIPNQVLKKKFRLANSAAGYSHANTLGLTANWAAYTYGEEWHDDLVSYLEENLTFVRDFLEKELPQIKLVEPEGTYLIWLDCSGLTDDYRKLREIFEEKAHLWTDDGVIFGRDSALFERINIATQRSVLERAFNQLKEAIT